MEQKKFKIAILGAGSWGYALAQLFSSSGFEVHLWSSNKNTFEILEREGYHPSFKEILHSKEITLFSSLEDAICSVDCIIEALTVSGVRSVFSQKPEIKDIPFIVSSKGVEIHSLKTPYHILEEIYGKSILKNLFVLSGPSFAADVILKKPASLVLAGNDLMYAQDLCKTFNTNYFRLYSSLDVEGVSFGGALKNIYAIACGACHGLGLGESAKAALMTRGLHEMRKLIIALGGKSETVSGLSGMGDLILTCSSPLSRNFHYGELLTQNYNDETAKQEIGHVVEGAFTVQAVYELSRVMKVPMPIVDIIYHVIVHHLPPLLAVQKLMQRELKEEGV